MAVEKKWVWLCILGGLLMFIASLVGILVGTIAAVRFNKPQDYIVRFYAMLGASVPVFWLGLVLLFVFYFKFGLPSFSKSVLRWTPNISAAFFRLPLTFESTSTIYRRSKAFTASLSFIPSILFERKSIEEMSWI